MNEQSRADIPNFKVTSVSPPASSESQGDGSRAVRRTWPRMRAAASSIELLSADRLASELLIFLSILSDSKVFFFTNVTSCNYLAAEWIAVNFTITSGHVNELLFFLLIECSLQFCFCLLKQSQKGQGYPCLGLFGHVTREVGPKRSPPSPVGPECHVNQGVVKCRKNQLPASCK